MIAKNEKTRDVPIKMRIHDEWKRDQVKRSACASEKNLAPVHIDKFGVIVHNRRLQTMLDTHLPADDRRRGSISSMAFQVPARENSRR